MDFYYRCNIFGTSSPHFGVMLLLPVNQCALPYDQMLV